MDCPHIKINKETVEYINKFNTDEELLRSGGLPTEILDRLAFGFSDEDIKTINPDQLNIKWHDDMDNVKWEQQKSGLSKVAWAKTINLSEPIDVVFEKNKFYIDDGHHRSYAAKILKQPLNVNLVIKMNPIVALTPNLGYDDFHRCLFKQIKNNLPSRDYALNEQLTKMKRVMGIKPINEYITQDEVYLRNYFNMSEEQKKRGLPHEYPWFFKDFLVEYDIDFETPTHDYSDVDGEQKGEPYEDYEIADWLSQNNKPLFDKFSDYLYDRINDHELDIPDAEYPAWSFFGEGKLVKNQWLIHFTNDPWSIAKNGFTRGVSEIEKLGLTTHLGEFDKKYGGYNFAFRAEIYHRYAKGRHGYKYGDEAVMFIGSGIEAHHYGDEEPQVIFFGKNAKYIVPITKEWDDYAVHNLKSGGIIYKSQDLDDVVSWVMRNYQQYQNKINYEPQRVKK
jgi:hypothetical protein